MLVAIPQLFFYHSNTLETKKNPIPIPLYLVCLKPFITTYSGVPPSLPLYFTLNPFFWDLKWPSRPPPLICLSSSFASFSRRSLLLIPISWLMSLTLISLPSWVSWPLFVCLSSLFSEGKGKGKLMNGFWIFFFLVFCYVSLFGFAFLVEDPFKKSAFFAFSGFYCCLNGGSWGHTGKEKKRNWSSMVWDIVNCTGKRLCLIIWPRGVDFCFLSGDGKPKMSNFLSFLGNRAELW